MGKILLGILIGIILVVGGLLLIKPNQVKQAFQVQPYTTNELQPNASTVPESPQTTVTPAQLQSMSSNKYADGNLPLGDYKYTTDTPKKGYIYLCNALQDARGGGSQVNGPWIHGNTWNINEKLSVQGKVNWPNAQFSNTVSGSNRTLAGNDLPVGVTTGTFPIQSTDPAHQYDQNPNSIDAQNFSDILPTNPTYSDTPFCMGGEVGVMLDGVALFNGFDAGLRDAAAHEVQDSCQGHPQQFGEYHYHSLSSCINDTSVSSVIGFALDGFPITGPNVSAGKYLTTDDLDECHGITSQINLDGKQVTMYHYIMTEDFPYSVSCFRGKPASMQVIKLNNSNPQGVSSSPVQPQNQTPP